jgi:hypothetical protein
VTPEPTTLPHKTDYGPFERIVEPGRHVYRATMDYRRWMIGGFCAIVAVVAGWIGWQFYPSPAEMEMPLMPSIALLPIVTSIVFALLSIPAFVMSVRLTITHDEVALYRIQFFLGKIGTTTKWRIKDVSSININTLPMGHWGRTLIHSAVIEGVDGTTVNLHVSFEDRPVIERFTNDIKESIIQMSQRG